MKPFGRKSVATNCRAAKFKAAKPTNPQARAGHFKKETWSGRFLSPFLYSAFLGRTHQTHQFG